MLSCKMGRVQIIKIRAIHYYMPGLSTLQVFSSVQSLSHRRLSATPWAAARQASLSITNSQSLLKLTSIESVMPPSHLLLCRPLLLPPSVFPSIRVSSSESALCIRWPESCSFSVRPSVQQGALHRCDFFDVYLLGCATFWSQPTGSFSSRVSSWLQCMGSSSRARDRTQAPLLGECGISATRPLGKSLQM